MITIERKELKKEWAFLIQFIQHKHRFSEDSKRLLRENKDIMGYTVIEQYFAMSDNELFISYEMESLIIDKPLIDGTASAGRRIMSVTIYDNYVEYETARMKNLGRAATEGHSTEGLNLN